MENGNRSLTTEEHQQRAKKANRKTKIITAILIIIAAILVITEIIFFFYLYAKDVNAWRIILVCVSWPFNYLITAICIALSIGIAFYMIPNRWNSVENMIDIEVKYVIYCILITVLFVLGSNLIFWNLIFKIWPTLRHYLFTRKINIYWPWEIIPGSKFF